MADVIPRPTEGDVIDLILADHRLFEELLRQLRDDTNDRDGLRTILSRVLVAHAEAEEMVVYPQFRKRRSLDSGKAEHGMHEHDEGHGALLELLTLKDTGGDEFNQALHELSTALHHHVDEEEREMLNPARREVSDQVRAELGAAFARQRIAQMDDDCGSVENVQSLVDRASERSD
ncbi:MAG: hemerythrin domain-containing protein [Nocardioidaceae bacterium]